MKITIEFDTKEELMEAQLASALGDLLMNHSDDRVLRPSVVFKEEAQLPPEETEPVPEDDIPDFEEKENPPPYTLEDLRAKVTSVAVILGEGEEREGITLLLDWIEKMTGSRKVSESDTTHYTIIGVWMDEVLAGGGDE